MSDPIEAFLILGRSGSQGRSALMALAAPLARGGVNLNDPRLIEEVWSQQVADAARDGDMEAWRILGEIGVRQPAWIHLPDGRERPLIASLLADGPRKFEALTSPFWQSTIAEGLSYIQVDEEHWTQGQALAVLRQLLALGHLELASTFQARLNLPLNDLALQERTPLARGLDNEAWAWFLAHGGDPMAPSFSGEPLWVHAASTLSPGQSASIGYTSLRHLRPSEAALAWGQAHDVEGAAALRRREYFERLAELNKELIQQDWRAKKEEERASRAWTVMTSHPDWLTLTHPSGMPAAFLAVHACPHLLALPNLPEALWSLRCQTALVAPESSRRRSWHDDLEPGDSFWAVVLHAGGNRLAPVIKALLHHVPLPEQVQKGWLVRWPHAGAHVALMDDPEASGRANQMPKAWSQVLNTRTDLFWAGSPKDQEAVAHRWWSSPAKPSLAVLALRTLPPEAPVTIAPLLRGALLVFKALQAPSNSPLTVEQIRLWVQAGVTWPEQPPEDIEGTVYQALVTECASIVALVRESHLSQRLSPSSPSRPRRRA